MPFYYIEYGIAQLGALQLWLNSKKDVSAAVANYRKALALGGSRPLPELFTAAKIKFDFGPKTGFCLAHFGPNLPSPPAPTLLGFYWAKSLSPAPRRFTAWSLAIFNKSDAVQTSLFLLKRTRSIKSLATLCTHSPTRFLQHAVPPP